MEFEKYLPLGTVVMLKGAKKRIMIIGYLPVTIKDNKKMVHDYAACIYPEGIISSDSTLLFNHDQIDKIYFLGNYDGEAKELIDRLKNTNVDDLLKEEPKKEENNKQELIIED